MARAGGPPAISVRTSAGLCYPHLPYLYVGLPPLCWAVGLFVSLCTESGWLLTIFFFVSTFGGEEAP
jgi:hypothetical protein